MSVVFLFVENQMILKCIARHAVLREW